jgi:NADH-quinone oxidoreductase subunit M
MALASVGLPGLNNFVGEFLVLLGTFVVSEPYAVVAVTALVLSAIYLLWGYQRAFHGAPAVAGGTGPAGGPSGNGHADVRPVRDLTVREYVVLVPLIAAVLVLGLFPKPLLTRIEPATKRTVACVKSRGAAAGWTGYVPLTVQIGRGCGP